MTRCPLALLPLICVAALGVATPAAARLPVPGGASELEAHASQSRQARAKRIQTRGRLGYARVFKRQQPVRGRQLRRLLRGYQNANPPGRQRPGTVPAGPRTPLTPRAFIDPPLDAVGRSDAPHPRAPEPSAAAATAAPVARAAAAPNDYVLFRSQPVAQGAGVTFTTGEPTVANDRNALLFTGNIHAAVSEDNGITWQYVDPTDTDYAQYDAGFCCDQIAYAVDRGPYSLVFWLRQFANDGALNPTDGANGRLSLITYQGRRELLDDGAQAEFCEVDFKPSQFGLPANTWFDFNQMSHTREFLYISSKAMRNLGDTDGDGRFNSQFIDGVVWRIALDDLDSDNCSPPAEYVRGRATGRNPALVQGAAGAGGGDTMYWASQGSANDGIEITRLRDGSDTASVFTRSISPFLITERPPASSTLNGTCPLPDATDPCQRINDDINIGYMTRTEVGWFWNVRQGAGFPFPHIRGARFSLILPDPTTGALDPLLIDEPDIWHPEHAWIYPGLGVNDAGHVGLTAYDAGGGSYVRAAAALIDDLTPSWSSLSFHGIVTSSHGTTRNTWGDYQSVRPYGNCTGTFAAAVHSMQGGSRDANAQHRFAWFGRERDACADLSVVSLGVLPTSAGTGEDLFIGHTTRNLGAGTGGASTTRFYLSRDASKSDDDVRLNGTSAVPALARGASHGELISAPAPHGTGTRYLLACADDTTAVAEITDTNNCMVADDTVLLEGLTGTQPNDIDQGPIVHAPAGASVRVRMRFDVPARAPRATAHAYLSPKSRVQRGMKRLGSFPVRRTGGARQLRVTRRLRMPRSAPRRRQFLVVCVGARRNADRCLVARRPLYVTKRRR
jgi:hypothetical protein